VLSEQELRAIQDRVNAASEGPWSLEGEDDDDFDCETVESVRFGPDYDLLGFTDGWECGDLHFITHARSDVPALLAEVRRLKQIEAAAREVEAEMGAEIRRRLLGG